MCLRSLPVCFAILQFITSLSAQDEKLSEDRRTLKSGGRERAYHLYVPNSLNRETSAPLLFCFHGAGGNGQGEMRKFRDLADEHGFLLVGPDGINKRWNAGCEDEIKATGGADDVAFVRDMVKAISSEFKVDPTRIYGYGFSNGSALLHRLAAEIPEVFAAMSGNGGSMALNTSESLKPGLPVSNQIMVGSEDSMFGHKGNLRGGTFNTATETARIWSEHNQCGAPVEVEKPVPHTRWPATTDVGEVELWIVDGAGHTPNMSEAFDTASEAWKFLSRQKRDPEKTSSHLALSDIPYKTGEESDPYEKQRCKLDVYLPEQDGPHPVLVWFHGGGLKGGDKQGTPNDGVKPKFMANSLAEAGVIVVCPNYRFSPKVQFPAYLEDAAAAVAWAKENLKEHDADPDRIFVGGHSAGGWLAFMLGLNSDYLKGAGVEPSDLAGFIPVSGQTVTHSTVRGEKGHTNRYSIIADEAAPVFHMRKETPPFLVIWADKDMAGRADENEYFVEMMKAAGNKNITGLMVSDRNHGTIASAIANPGDPAREAILKFVND